MSIIFIIQYYLNKPKGAMSHMSYIISDHQEKHFLHLNKNNSFSITTDRRQAYKWNTFNKANNVLVNLPNSLSFYTTTWKIIFDKQSSKTTSITPTPILTSSSKSTSKTSLKEDIISFRKRLEDELNSLSEQLSDVDKEKEDVIHYIEFNTLNACQGYKIYNLLHEIMQDRREIKNKFSYIQSILDNLDSTILKNNKPHTYTPKALPTLFTEGI